MGTSQVNLAQIFRDAQTTDPEITAFFVEIAKLLSETATKSYYETLVETSLDASSDKIKNLVQKYGLHFVEGGSKTTYLCWSKGVEI